MPLVLKASNEVLGLDKLPWHKTTPIFSSPKIDGNRLIVAGGQLLSSSGKAPRNAHLYNRFRALIEYTERHEMMFDGELFAPSCAHHAELSGIINSYSQPLPQDMQHYIFDAAAIADWTSECRDMPYTQRSSMYHYLIRKENFPHVVALPQRLVTTAEEAQELFEKDVANGFEGSMIRPGDIWYEGNNIRGGWYKHGRATNTQAIIWKAKAYATMDGVIIGAVERKSIRDDWDRTYTDGRLDHPNEKDAFVGADTLGSFIARIINEDGTFFDTELMFGRGFDLPWRQHVWNELKSDPSAYANRWVEFIHLPHGAKKNGKIRQGRLQRFRDDIHPESTWPFTLYRHGEEVRLV